MADLTLADVFGVSASFDDDAGTITFSLADFNNFDIYNPPITQNNINEQASKIFWAILDRIYYEQPETNNDATRLIYITNQGKRTAVRNGVAQFSFGLLASGYVNDPLGTNLHPNDLGGGSFEGGEGGQAF